MACKWIGVGFWCMMMTMTRRGNVFTTAERVLLGCSGGRVYSADIATGVTPNQLDFTEVLSFFPKPVYDIQQDLDSGKVYVRTAYNDETVYRANEDWSCLEEVVNNCTFGNHICITNQQLYWINRNDDTVNRLNLDGSGNTLITSATNPLAMAVDHRDGFIYYAESSTMVKKSDLDGNVISTVISNLGNAQSVVIDDVERKLYAAGFNSAKILKYDLDTETESTLYNGDADYYLLRDMAVLNDWLLLPCRSRSADKYVLAAIPKVGGSVITITTTGLGPAGFETNWCGVLQSIHVLKDDQVFPTEPCAATPPILYSCPMPPTPGPTTVHTTTAEPTTVRTTTAEPTTVHITTAEPTDHTTTISDEASTAKPATATNVGRSAIYHPKTLCFLNKEPVGGPVVPYSNQLRWVLDIPKDEVCRCKRVQLGAIYRKPVSRNFEPYYPTCPSDILNKDEETTAKMLLC